MAANSLIEWTDHTFNPWHGCVKVSPGCTFCYAALRDRRHLHEPVDHWGRGASRMLRSDAAWDEPLLWNRTAAKNCVRYKVFCASMADVFEEGAPTGEQKRLWRLIEATPNLDWQLLTKRPERILNVVPRAWREAPRHNVWFGTSVENEDYRWRLDHLQEVPAVVTFVSVEPLLGAVHLDEWLYGAWALKWVIVGGESGPFARPMHPDWVRCLREQCLEAQVPFFFKQWGEWCPYEAGMTIATNKRQVLLLPDGKQPPEGVVTAHRTARLVRLGKRTAGRRLDGRTWSDFPSQGRQ